MFSILFQLLTRDTVFLAIAYDNQLPINNGPNSLHGGGPVAFHNRIWEANQKDGKIIEFTTTSPDGEDGYPGNLDVKVTYALTEDNTLIINYFANTDKPTVLNLTNHCYFNLSGDGSKDCLDEVLMLDADQFTAVDADVAVTGEVLAINEELDAQPELVNNDPYGEGWIIKIAVKDIAELDNLMDAEAYQATIG